jgi:hypothetical protein
MDTLKINEQLLAVGEKLKAKGWATVGIRIWVEYLAALDRPQSALDPMLSYRPSISATPHRPDGSFYGSGSSQEYVKDGWGVKSLDEAIAKLHEAADSMPRMFDEAARIDAVKSKLTESERQLLGVR